MTIEICVDQEWATYIEEACLHIDGCALKDKVYKNGGYYWLTIEIGNNGLPDLLEAFFKAGVSFQYDNTSFTY